MTHIAGVGGARGAPLWVRVAVCCASPLYAKIRGSFFRSRLRSRLALHRIHHTPHQKLPVSYGDPREHQSSAVATAFVSHIYSIHKAQLLNVYRGEATDAPSRSLTAYHPLSTFVLDKDRQYQQQFADMYFLRLAKIKPAVDNIAQESWQDTVIGGERAKHMERVLDVRQGELCWVVGTVYMDMPLKPDVLDDVTKDVSEGPSLDALHCQGGASADYQVALDICSALGPEILLRGRKRGFHA